MNIPNSVIEDAKAAGFYSEGSSILAEGRLASVYITEQLIKFAELTLARNVQEVSNQNALKAFPSHGSMGEVVNEGLDLRDYFAAKALQGLLPARDAVGRTAFTELTPEHCAESAYKIADAMMKAREL